MVNKRRNWNKYLLGTFIFVVLFSGNSFSQQKAIAVIDTPAKTVFIDNLDAVYVLTPKDELLKYDTKGALKWRYSNNRYGKVKSIDVTDPLRVVIFYADFQQVVVLNNNLSQIATYSFAYNSNLLVSAIAVADNNAFWIFETTSNSLIKLSSDFSENTRSANLYQLFDELVFPKKILVANQHIYLQKPNNDVLIFDVFGAFLRLLSLEGLADFEIHNNKLIYMAEKKLHLYDLNSQKVSTTLLPVGVEIKQVALGNKIIAALTEKGVFLYPAN
ncbi:hypothetical protein [Pedobacter montanisoli]|uniref:Uncharacterized protein n=1 Tax=Pedobacter montanisoli TaxID=2923277 RepID=A0ABS9ZTI4_9SPHI|nr:hypothetical protein [Pedobacter montanisoli]MCJ0741904.1 hypothetical protein [Pedobacter montanisoli]